MGVAVDVAQDDDARENEQQQQRSEQARTGFHALLRTGSMAREAGQSMSAAEFYDHLADTGWLTFLSASHVFEAGDDMPCDVLAGTER
eukprot:SAG22_NODE_6342_length_868_cov_1.006502_2_plen_88_part_00